MVDSKNNVNKPLYVLMIMLSAFSGILLLIRFLGFNIVVMPLADIFLCIALSAIIIVLTTFNMKTKCENTKAFSNVYIFLPGLSIVFVLLINNTMNTSARLILFLVTLGCGITLFFSGIKCRLIKISLGIVYSIVIIPIVSVLLLSTILPPFGHNEVIQSTLSPNGYYKAELWSNCQGALGGATWIDVTRQPDRINLFFAELHRRSTRVYSGRWGESYRMTLHWETDNLLYVDFDTPFAFRFNGQQWIRE